MDIQYLKDNTASGQLMPLEFFGFHDIVLDAPCPACGRKNQFYECAILYWVGAL